MIGDPPTDAVMTRDLAVDFWYAAMAALDDDLADASRWCALVGDELYTIADQLERSH